MVAALLVAGCHRRIATRADVVISKPVGAGWEGIKYGEATITKFPEKEHLWIYEPDDHRRLHPCVFVAAEAEDEFHGARLSETDRASHLPYARAGYTVVGYDVSGEAPPSGDAGKGTSSVVLFAKRDVGIQNAKAAIDYALHHLQIDPLRLYVAGHGAAGTLALQASAADSRIRGCVAYSPIVPTASGAPYERDEIAEAAPAALRVIQKFSLAATASDVQCPVMLFAAPDEGDVKSYAQLLQRRGHEADLATSPNLAASIAQGVAWLGRARHNKT